LAAVSTLKSKILDDAYSGLLFNIKPDVSTVTGSNQETQLTAEFTCTVSEAVIMCIPSELFLNTVKLIKSPDINIIYSREEDKCSLVIDTPQGKFTIACYNPDVYAIMKIEENKGDAEADYPVLNNIIQIASGVLEQKDITSALSGINIVTEGDTIRCTGATNSLFFKNYCEQNGFGIEGVIIPNSFWAAMAGMPEGIETMKLITDNGRLEMSAGGISIITKLIDLKYPDTEGIFNDRPDKFFLVNRYEMVDALNLMRIYADEKEQLCVIKIEDAKLTILASDEGLGNDANNWVEIESPEPINLELSFKINELLHIMNNTPSPKVKVYYSVNNKPIYIEQEDQSSKLLWALAVYRKKEKS